MNKYINVVLLFAFGVCFLSYADPRPDMVAKVKSGAIKEARVSWWGFNPDDSTAFLQAAIDSRVPRLIIDSMPNSWYTTPLKCVSNQEIIFEKGARLSAKRNAFQNKTDTLLTLSSVTNVTIRGQAAEIRMFRDDYAKPPYDFGLIGYRNAITIKSCSKITLDGLVISQAGGCGIEVVNHSGQYKLPSTDIKITNCTVSKSCRAGLALAGVKGFTAENLRIDDASGTWPKAGIQITSDSGKQFLQDIVFRKCSTGGSMECAVLFQMSGERKPGAKPVGVSFEKCDINNGAHSVSYGGGADGKNVTGKISFTDCNFRNSSRASVKITQKPAGAVSMEFVRCIIENCSESSRSDPDVRLSAGSNMDPPVDGLVFKNVEIHQQDKRDWISPVRGNYMAADVRNITGNVKVFMHKTTKEYTLNDTWRKTVFPPKSREPTPPRFVFNPAATVVYDHDQGTQVELSRFPIRGHGKFVFYAAKPMKVVLTLRYIPVSKSRSSSPVVVSAYGGKAVKSLYLPDFWEEGRGDSTYSFEVPDAGFYTVDVNPGHNDFMFTTANVPIAVSVESSCQLFHGGAGSLYLVPPRGRRFAMFITGSCDYDLLQANGTSCMKGEPCPDWNRFYGSSNGINDIWSLNIIKPKHGGLGEYKIDLTGMQGFLFLSNKKCWRSK